MQQLGELQFEPLIGPAFEQDGWIPITAGAQLGSAMGGEQALVLETSPRAEDSAAQVPCISCPHAAAAQSFAAASPR